MKPLGDICITRQEGLHHGSSTKATRLEYLHRSSCSKNPKTARTGGADSARICAARFSGCWADSIDQHSLRLGKRQQYSKSQDVAAYCRSTQSKKGPQCPTKRVAVENLQLALDKRYRFSTMQPVTLGDRLNNSETRTTPPVPLCVTHGVAGGVFFLEGTPMVRRGRSRNTESKVRVRIQLGFEWRSKWPDQYGGDVFLKASSDD